MKKTITPGTNANLGSRIRLLRGPWGKICEAVASEIVSKANLGNAGNPDTALLFFSTSEKGSKRHGPSAPAQLRAAIEATGGIRVYNVRNKTAGRDGPAAELLGLISYLIDPIQYRPVGVGGRSVMVCASEPKYAAYALASPPSFGLNSGHLGFQKRFMKADNGDIGRPIGDRAPIVQYVDEIRDRLANAYAANRKPRLTLSGFVARLLSFPRFRDTGYTEALFREALFTEILESSIAPTRRSKSSLDSPLTVKKVKNKYAWNDEYWTFLGHFGALLTETDLDDPDVEAFEEGAVQMMTFHQSKGLEYSQVYIGGTGRAVAPHSVLRTMLFSGKTPKYSINNYQPVTRDTSVLTLAEADRERELYVALTRAKRELTFLHDPKDTGPLMALHPVLETLFKKAKAKRHRSAKDVEVLEYVP